MTENPNTAEAERLLGVAEKLLQSRDFAACRDFAILAQETEPLLDGSDQILAVADVLAASDKRVNNHHDWYAILQVDRLSADQDLLKKQYRLLALLLHPDKNKYPFADQAFKLVVDAWAVLSDSVKKSLFDKELGLFSPADLANSGKLPVRRSPRTEPVRTGEGNRSGDGNQRSNLSSFWTACPYCYILYEYPGVYRDCCLRCQNCNRAFHAAVVSSLPPLVPGKEAYYCCWGFFPLGFVSENGGKNSGADQAAGFPNWMPPIFGPGTATPPPQQQPTVVPNLNAGSRQSPVPASTMNDLMSRGSGSGGGVARGGGSVQVAGVNSSGLAGKKRGRPRKQL